MTPFEWIALALMVAGTAANANAQRKTNKARAKVFGEETDRRKELQKKVAASAQQSADTLTNTANRQKEREAELAATYSTETAPTPITTDSGTRFLDTEAPTQSTRTIEETAKQIAAGRERSNVRGASQGKLQAYGDVMNENTLFNARNAQDIAQQQGFMSGWQQNVLPALANKANMAGKGWATAGDIMKLVSTVMSMGAGAAGAGAGSGAVTVSPESTAGVLDRMSGIPSEFAGMKLAGFNSIPFSQAASLGTAVAPAAASAFDSGIEAGALTNLGHNIFQNPMQQAILRKQMMGIPLTMREQQYMAQHY